MIWVYFLIGLTVDWLSNSRYPFFTSEDSTRGGFASSQLFCKLITGGSPGTRPERLAALSSLRKAGGAADRAGVHIAAAPVGGEGPSFFHSEQAMDAHFYALISILRLPGRASRHDLCCFSAEELGLFSWAAEPPIKLAKLIVSAALWGQRKDSPRPLKYILFSSYRMELISPHVICVRVPFCSAPVMCRLALIPTSSFQLCTVGDRPLHTTSRLFCQLASREVWPVGGTRGHQTEVGWVHFPEPPLQSTTN